MGLPAATIAASCSAVPPKYHLSTPNFLESLPCAIVSPFFGHHGQLNLYSIKYQMTRKRGSIGDGTRRRRFPIVPHGVGDPEDNPESDDEVVRAIGARVRQLREAADLTQEELGARSNLTPKFISKVENGHANPSIGVVARLCVGLNLPLSAFFAEDPNSDLARDLAEVTLLLSGETSEVRAQAIRILRALLNR